MSKNVLYDGIWFYGLSGSGKTYASKYLFKKIKKTILIDGDDVRKFISNDLQYDKNSRVVQIQRIFGILKIIKKSKSFPIVSTVYMNKNWANKLKKENIFLCKVENSNFENIKRTHKTYIKNKQNVVGIDIFYEKFISFKIINNNKNFKKKLDYLVEKYNLDEKFN